jgi:2-dehydropantoate 2-reductase
MRITIMGAGAVGCFLGARLSERGHAVTLIGRPAQVEAIAREGLLVREQSGREQRYTLRAVAAAAALNETPELVLLAVKTQDEAGACSELLPYVRGVPVVAMQNGLDGDRIAAEILGEEAVLSGVVMCAVTYVTAGEVTVHFAGWIILGEPFGPLKPRTRAIARVLGAVVPTYVTTDVRRARWTKLISNLNNGICAASGLTLPELAATEPGRLLSLRVMKEGYRVARADGVRLDHALYGLTPRTLGRDANATLIALLQTTVTSVMAVAPERLALRVLAVAGRSRLNQLPIHFSTWQSIARGRPSEIEYLNGAVVRLGGALHVPTPYNTRIVEQVHAAERSQMFSSVEALFPLGVRARAAVSARGDTL